MVSAKQGNMRRRQPGTQGNSRRFKPPVPRLAMGNNYIRTPINPMFNSSQIPDNPGYVDFNEPTPPPPRIPSPIKINNSAAPPKHRYPRRAQGQTNMKPNPHRNQNGAAGWNQSRIPPGQMNNQPPVPHPHGRNFRNGPMPRIGRPMPPPIGMRAPMPPPPAPPSLNANRFGPRPLIPPPIAGCPPGGPPLGPPRPPIRVGGPIPPRPGLPRNNAGQVGGPIRRGKVITNNRKNIKGRKRLGNVGPALKGKKSTTIKKTLSEIINQYPLDKPWVTDEIRNEQKIKEDIENKLKGNKNDKLFAEFKVQRDKFVKMYEAARLEYIGKHPEQDIDKILTESDKKKGETNAKEKPNENRKTIEKPAAK